MAITKQIIRAVLRGLSYREIVSMYSCSNRDVSSVKQLINGHEITEEKLANMTAGDVQALVDKGKPERVSSFLEPDFEQLVTKLANNKYYTLRQGWKTYCEQTTMTDKTYSYSRFCQRFNNYVKRHHLSAKLTHSPGRLMMVDWAGSTVSLHESFTDKQTVGYVFVATLPYSGMVYAQAFPTMAMSSWLQAHVDAFDYFGGVPQIVVPDNVRTAITPERSSGYRYVNKEYEQFASHYEFGIMPTRVRKPKDKGSVEAGVHVINQAVISVIHELRFHDWATMNRHITMLIDEVNTRPFRGKDVTRRSIFEEEVLLLQPLPDVPYIKVSWSTCTVGPNYHVYVDYRRYSVPYTLVGKTVHVKRTDHEIVIMHNGDVIATHIPAVHKGEYRTDASHVPKEHENMDNLWTTQQFTQRASTIGGYTVTVIRTLLENVQHAPQAFIACDNVLQLSRKHGSTTLEKACEILVTTNMRVSQTAVLNMVKSIVTENKRTRSHRVTVTNPTMLCDDDHIRGGDYYETTTNNTTTNINSFEEKTHG